MSHRRRMQKRHYSAAQLSAMRDVRVGSLCTLVDFKNSQTLSASAPWARHWTNELFPPNGRPSAGHPMWTTATIVGFAKSSSVWDVDVILWLNNEKKFVTYPKEQFKGWIRQGYIRAARLD